MTPRNKAIIFSLIIHALLVYLFINARFDLREYKIKERVIDVVPVATVPRQKLFLPKEALQPPPKSQPQQVPVPPQSQAQAAAPKKAAVPPPQGRVPVIIKKFEMKSPPPGDPNGNRQKQADIFSRPPETKNKKDLEPPEEMGKPDLKPEPKQEPKPDKNLEPASSMAVPLPKEKFLDPKPSRLVIPDLSVNSPAMKEILKNFNRSEREGVESVNTERKLSDFTNVPFKDSNDAFGGGGDGITAYGGGAYFNSKGYDVTPWAKRIVYRIKRNWLIPEAARVGLKGVVGVYVIFGKNGRVLHMELRQSSKIGSYDQAAMNAFTLSNPFPELPDDFPNPDMEAYFLFHYN